MKRLLIFILFSFNLLWSQQNANDLETKAYRARLEGQNTISAVKFEELALNKNKAYQLQSVFSWLDLAPTSPEYYLKARSSLDSFLVHLEPEDTLYFPALLTRVWVLHESGQSDSASVFLNESAAHLTRADHPLYLWMQFHVFHEEQSELAQAARKELFRLYPRSPESLSLKALGVESTGKDKPKSTKQLTTNAQALPFEIQLGAFSTKENGQRAIDNLGALPGGYESYLLNDKTRGLFLFRVLGFESKEKAHRFAAEELRLEKGQYLVILSR